MEQKEHGPLLYLPGNVACFSIVPGIHSARYIVLVHGHSVCTLHHSFPLHFERAVLMFLAGNPSNCSSQFDRLLLKKQITAQVRGTRYRNLLSYLYSSLNILSTSSSNTTMQIICVIISIITDACVDHGTMQCKIRQFFFSFSLSSIHFHPFIRIQPFLFVCLLPSSLPLNYQFSHQQLTDPCIGPSIIVASVHLCLHPFFISVSIYPSLSIHPYLSIHQMYLLICCK